MSEQVLAGLKKMDPNNDNHWTMDGQANLATVKFHSGATVTRDELEVIAPGFNRQAMRDYVASLVTSEAGNGEVQKPGPIGTGSENAESAEADTGFTDRETEVETLAEKIARADETVLELKRIYEQTGKDLAEATRESERLHDRMIVVNPPMTHQQTVRAYLDTVSGLRQRRTDAREALANSGIDIDGLQSAAAPAPIDQLMKGRARITARR